MPPKTGKTFLWCLSLPSWEWKRGDLVAFRALECCQSILQVPFWTKGVYECLDVASEIGVAGVTLAPLTWWHSMTFRNPVNPCHGGDSSSECGQGPVVHKASAERCTLPSWAFLCCLDPRTFLSAIFCISIFFTSLCGSWKCFCRIDLETHLWSVSTLAFCSCPVLKAGFCSHWTHCVTRQVGGFENVFTELRLFLLYR